MMIIGNGFEPTSLFEVRLVPRKSQPTNQMERP